MTAQPHPSGKELRGARHFCEAEVKEVCREQVIEQGLRDIDFRWPPFNYNFEYSKIVWAGDAVPGRGTFSVIDAPAISGPNLAFVAQVSTGKRRFIENAVERRK